MHARQRNLCFISLLIITLHISSYHDCAHTELITGYFTFREAELYRYIEGQENKNTRRKIDGSVRRFQTWITETQSSSPNPELHKYPPQELNRLLGTFLMSIRKPNGQNYEPDTLTGYLRNINSHLKKLKYPFDILDSKEFELSRDVLMSRRKSLKKQGFGNRPNRADALSEEDERQLWAKGQLGMDTPTALQNTVWFFNTKCLGFRGSDESKQLKWGDILLTIDHATGEEYLEWETERSTKTRDGVNAHSRPFNPKIFAAGNPDRCPIRAYKKFRSERPLEMLKADAPFYLAINHQRKEYSKWYKNGPLGIHSITNILSKMKKNANLSGKLTNHSVRRTMCTDLVNAGVAPTVIAQLSGHKNVASISNYSTADTNMQKKLCKILVNKGIGDDSGTMDLQPSPTSNNPSNRCKTKRPRSFALGSEEESNHVPKQAKTTRPTFSDPVHSVGTKSAIPAAVGRNYDMGEPDHVHDVQGTHSPDSLSKPDSDADGIVGLFHRTIINGGNFTININKN